MNKLLITGGSGFIGANFTHYWLQHFPNDSVVVLDKLTYAGNVNNLKDLEQTPQFKFIQGDIGDEKLVSQIFQQFGINIVVNFAAETHVDRSIKNPDVFVATNVLGTYNLLKVAKKIWLDNPSFNPQITRFHHISTDEIYGSLALKDPAFTENSLISPNSPYSASKAAADHFVRAFYVTYGLNTTISHCSNNYGPYHFPEKLIPLAILKILHGESIPIYGDGQQIRDWLHVTDHCRAVEYILRNGQVGEKYNIGGYQGELTNLTLVKKLFAYVDHFFSIQPERKHQYPNAFPTRNIPVEQALLHVTDRLGHDRRYAINSTKIIEQLKFNYSVDIEYGLKNTVLWYLNNKSWWQELYQPDMLAMPIEEPIPM
jgi:dTDP-glucose 4,6-dehydratase